MNVLLAALTCVAQGDEPAAIRAWPAEPEEQARNFTALSKDFRKDLSGAVWNPVTRTLWLCRNGPGENSKLWVLEEGDEIDPPRDNDTHAPPSTGHEAQAPPHADVVQTGSPARGLRIATRGETLGEWSELGDAEGLTFADFAEHTVFVILEGDEAIHELDVSVFAELRVRRVYDTSAFLPLEGKRGSEGLTFVPDAQLAAADFVDADGAPRQSRHGAGGLFFVGHQNGGGLYAFDLDRATGGVDFVGEYRVLRNVNETREPLSEVAGLEFDRASGTLFVWHNFKDRNLLSLTSLGSEAVPDASYRALADARVFEGPSDRNYEGLALVPNHDGGTAPRTLYLTVDDSKKHALLRYEHFAAR